jgi:hypothetical protein
LAEMYVVKHKERWGSMMLKDKHCRSPTDEWSNLRIQWHISCGVVFKKLSMCLNCTRTVRTRDGQCTKSVRKSVYRANRRIYAAPEREDGGRLGEITNVIESRPSDDISAPGLADTAERQWESSYPSRQRVILNCMSAFIICNMVCTFLTCFLPRMFSCCIQASLTAMHVSHRYETCFLPLLPTSRSSRSQKILLLATSNVVTTDFHQHAFICESQVECIRYSLAFNLTSCLCHICW